MRRRLYSKRKVKLYMYYMYVLSDHDSAPAAVWSLTLNLMVSSAENFWKQFGPRSGPTPGLIGIQTVWPADGIPEIIFKKKDFETDDKNACKITQHAKS